MTSQDASRMVWHTTTVAGRTARYGVGGSGPPLVFLHGWGIADRPFTSALESLTAAGLRVYAPAMPGFGGTAELPRDEHDLRGYARWVAAFADQVGITEPVTLVGYSFGGGVAIRTAHDAPELVRRLILVNSIGGSAWTDGRGVLKAITQRPLWDWGLHLQADLLPTRQAVRVLPVVVVWSKQDNVIPEATLMSLHACLGKPRMVTVPGGHTWLIAQPKRFGEVITNILSLGEDDDGQEAA